MDEERWLRRGFTRAEILAVEKRFRDRRRKIRSQFSSSPNSSVAERLAGKRFAYDVVRREQVKLLRGKSKKRITPSADLLTAEKSSSKILDALLVDRDELWKPAIRRPRYSDISSITLKTFSLLENPNVTFSQLSTIARAEATVLDAQLHFRDSVCLDIAPYLVLSLMRPAMMDIFRSGTMTRSIQKVIEAVGVRKALNMAPFNLKSIPDVWAFPVRMRRPTGSSKSPTVQLDPQTKEKVADDFCIAINSWLGRPELKSELNLRGRRSVKQLIGEVLDNAERHSHLGSDDGDWAMAGFMAKRAVDERALYVCHMAFISVGNSIAESFDRVYPDQLPEMAAYVRRHKRRSGPSEATLKTVYSLQDGVTSDQSALLARRGGVGLMEILGLVNALGTTFELEIPPKLTIISGSSVIFVRDPYLVGLQQEPNSNEPRQLWFNEENSADFAPSPDHVADLNYTFSGTIVTAVFVMDPRYVEALENAANRSD
jgi:hypothetical protein